MADSQRDRLVELLEVSVYGNIEIYDGFIGPEVNCENVADHLLANGVIVPPCHLNQTVWHISWNNRIEQCKVSSLTQKADSTFKIRITPPSKSVFEITPDEIGKTVFLTKEEAEEALSERNTEND